MKSTLEKSTSWYNPLYINGIEFKEINIVDGDKILFTFNWFSPYKSSSNSIKDPIELDAKLVKSKLSKNKLRYTGNKDNYVLHIDKSLLSYSLESEEVAQYECNDIRIETYKLDGVEAYFTVRTQLKPNKSQEAFLEVMSLCDGESFSTYDIKRVLKFCSENKKLLKKAGFNV